MSTNKKEYHCSHCNKYYSSQSSFCNHKKRFHSAVNILSIDNKDKINNTSINTVNQTDNSIIKTTLVCKYCKKVFSHKNSRWFHEKTCPNKEIVEREEQNKREQEQRKKEEEARKIEKEKLEIELLKKKLQSSNKIETTTLNKLNKILAERYNRIKNSTVNSYNTQNNITNNIQLVGFGKENIRELLTNDEKKLIVSSKYYSLQKLIDIVHCQNYNQFKNIIITNMKDNFVYVFDQKTGVFVLKDMKDVLKLLVDYRIEDLEILYSEFIKENKVDKRVKRSIEAFINKINTDEKEKKLEINEIKLLLYNNKDKITNDISMMLTVHEVDNYEEDNSDIESI